MKRRAGYDDAREKEKQETEGAIGAVIFVVIGILVTLDYLGFFSVFTGGFSNHMIR